MSDDVDARPTTDRLLDVAAAIADGRTVAPSRASDGDPEPLLRRLLAIEAISTAFGRVADVTTSGAPDAERAPLFTWGHLQVLEHLGAGGFGDVYRAWDPLLQREFALKLYRPSSTVWGTRQLGEARRLARIRHPNVLTVHGAAVHDGRTGLWSDFIAGATLEALLVDRGPFGASEAVVIGSELCAALAALHAEGIVHADVKAANVMRERGGRIVLMDLGAGRAIADATGGRVFGTRNAAAPEQLAGHPASPRSDVYSLGALLFRLLTGRHRREVDAEPEAAFAGALRDLRPDLSAELAEVVERALAADPESRFASAGAMQRALRQALPECAPARSMLRRYARGRAALWVGATASVVVGAAVLTSFRLASTNAGMDTPSARLTVGRSQLVASADVLGHGAFSPNGRALAYISAADGPAQLWLHEIASGTSRRLTELPVPVQRPAWAADGERLLFTVLGQVMSVSPAGGAAETVLHRAWNASASAQTGLLVFERGEEIWTAASNGSNAARIGAIPERAARISERLPTLSPDGSLIAFMHAAERPWGDVWIVSTSGGSPRRLTADGRALGKVAWSSDGGKILFSSRRGGELALWQVDVHRALGEGPQTPTPLLGGDGDHVDPALSPDGRLLAYTRVRNTYRLTAFDPATGHERTLHESRLTVLGPAVSNDGRRVAFFGWGSDGELHVYTVATGGGQTRQVTSADDGESTFPAWSADDRQIFFFGAAAEPSWRRVPASGGMSVDVGKGWTATDREMITIDPSGRRAAYTWYDRDVPLATRIMEIASGTEHEFRHLLRYPVFTPDGSSLVGVAAFDDPRLRSGRLVVCGVEAGGCRTLSARASHARVSPDGATVYFQRPTSAYNHRGVQLWSVSIDGSEESKVLDFVTEQPYLPAFDVSPSGKLVLARLEPGLHELWVAELGPIEGGGNAPGH